MSKRTRSGKGYERLEPSTRNAVDDIGPQRIPNELIRRVMDALHKEEQLATLSKMALASRALYELAIPKIYETIVVTENNMDQVPRIREDKSFSECIDGPPHKDWSSVISRSGPSLPPKSLIKRMKTAMAHCKRIVFGDHPSNEGPKFRGVILGFIRAQAASQPSKPLQVSFIIGGSQSISEAEFWETCYPHPSQNTHRCISIHVFSNRSNDLMLAIRSIASHKFQLPTIDIVLYNLPLRTGDVLGPIYACTTINVTVYFSVHQMKHENDRCYELASWLELFFFVHPGFSSAKCKVRLVDIPTLITPDDDLQDDRAKRIENARTEISRNLAAMDMWEEYTPKEEKRSRARVEEIMRRVELIDSPKGMEINWPAYDPDAYISDQSDYGDDWTDEYDSQEQDFEDYYEDYAQEEDLYDSGDDDFY